jgi:arginyl-tRNA synthetase
MIREEIKKLVIQSIRKAQKQSELPAFDVPEIIIEHPENPKFGDYSSNVAMKLAGVAKKSPMKIAEMISKRCLDMNKKKELFEEMEIAKPGFINFTLSSKLLVKQLKEVLKQKEEYGEVKVGKGKRIQVEFISANPTGPLTIGNGRGGFAGDVLANVLERAGFRVEREYYWNDAKSSALILGLGKSIKGEEVVYAGDYVKKLPKEIKEKYQKNIKDSSAEEAGYYASEVLKEKIRKVISEKLKIKFDNWLSEQSLYDSSAVEKALKVLQDKRLTYKKEGAVWFKAKEFGDDEDRVLVRSEGTPTYFLPDIAYHLDKFKRKFKKVIDIWGADHAGYIKRLQGAVTALGFKRKLDILITQLVRLMKEGKEMRVSKRRGVFVTLEELVNEVGLDVARFFFLMHSLNTHMDFDLDLAKERSEKNPVFYVQYAHARIASIIRKAEKEDVKFERKADLYLLRHKAELDLIRELIKFPELITDIAKNYEVHRLPYYTTELATKFHSFYKQCRVLSDNKDLTSARMALVSASRIVLRNVLGTMGIGAPEKM